MQQDENPYSPPRNHIGPTLDHGPRPRWLRRLRIGVIIVNSVLLFGVLPLLYGYIQAGIQKDGHPFGNAYFYLGGMFLTVGLFTITALTVGTRYRLAMWFACGANLLLAIQSSSELLRFNGTSIDLIGYLFIALFLVANLISVFMWRQQA
jgi:hypothetical protein